MNKFKALLRTKVFWLVVSAFFVILFGVLWNITDSLAFYWLSIFSFAYPIILLLISIVYAWIILPAKWMIKKIKRDK